MTEGVEVSVMTPEQCCLLLPSFPVGAVMQKPGSLEVLLMILEREEYPS